MRHESVTLDNLRSILLSERETGRLTVVTPDFYAKAHAELVSLVKQVYAFDDPFSDDAHTLIDETNAIKETLNEVFQLRSRKIIALTIMHAEGNYYDREEVKRMIPEEKEMFEGITQNIEQCQGILLHNVPPPPARLSVQPVEAGMGVEDETGEGEPVQEYEEEPVTIDGLPTPAKAASPLSPPCVLVHALENMESFMGVDGRVYTLSKGDIVTLPERNAAVLSERNIVLNINLCK